MLKTTRGIVFKTVNYSETSVIATIYTEQVGVQSYIINSVRTRKPRTKAALLQPLTLLDMVVYFRDNQKVQRTKELKLAFTFTSIPFHIGKSSLVLFIAEILFKTVKEHEPSPEQFDYIFEFIRFIDITAKPIANLHLVFLLQLSQFLGFHPQNNFSEKNTLFSFQEGTFTAKRPPHNHYIELPISRLLSEAMNLGYAQIHTLKLTKGQRKVLLHGLIAYYRLHVEGFKNVQSLKVLEAVLED